MRYGMVMAGGSGTRLWPMSRLARPKQLIPLVGGKSLLALAAERLEGVVPPERRLVCTGEGFRGAVREAIPWLDEANLLGEPCGRDTLNAVGLTAAVLARRDPEAVFAVLTADHLIEPREEFARRLEEGFRAVEADPRRLVTFGVTPTFPATGYGYVERGEPLPGLDRVFAARRFVEKPDRETAEAYLELGTFLWNSGMFVFRASTVLEAIRRYRPDTAEALARIAREWDEPDRAATLAAIYPSLYKISVDYGLMEPASRDGSLSICVVPMQLTWTDVGSWPSLAATLPADERGHRVSGARHVDIGSERCLVVSDDPDHVVATVGCQDLIVVRTRDATLVCRAADAERVKDAAGAVPPEVR